MKKETSIVFTGDIGFDRYMDGKWEDDALLAEDILSFLHSGDHVVANVEGPLVEQPTNKTTEGVVQLMHTMNPGAIKVLQKMQADIWNICNNHIMDAGEAGMEATLAEARKAGVQTLGAGRNITEASEPLYIEDAGGIGLIGVGYQRGCKPAGEEKAGCFDWSDMDRIAQKIAEIKKKVRWCIVVSHGGEEFTALPSPYTRDRYLEYLAMGADFVVCHHPHVPMNYETVGDKMIFYSLGNFIFDTDYQRAQYHTEDGVLLKLNLTEESYTFEAKGLKINRGSEHIEAAELPAIFTEVPAAEYEKLSPLAAKMFIAATKRQQIYLNKAEFENASEEKWAEHFANPRRSGRVEGQGLDFFIICPLAEREKEKAWEGSNLESVKNYILEQM
ncbi:MAG: CapA family protein [Lachnospiraceae bacterium]|nr:CapA family protein [Lachnospiraceae bacterium]